jgi:hypothetical protein
MTAAEAALVWVVSVRQVRRLLAAYRQEEVAELAHGHEGPDAWARPPPTDLPARAGPGHDGLRRGQLPAPTAH